MTGAVNLTVNDTPIELDSFVQGFINGTADGMLSSLKRTEKIETLDIFVDGEQVKIILNERIVPINPFVTKILNNTLTGMISSLKGVATIDSYHISVNR